MKRGKRGKAQSGFPIVAARPPYGYQVKSEPHKSWLVVDEAEARIVRVVFQWFLYGEAQTRITERKPLSLRAIAAKLGADHVPTRGDTMAHVAKRNGRGTWASRNGAPYFGQRDLYRYMVLRQNTYGGRG